MTIVTNINVSDDCCSAYLTSFREGSSKFDILTILRRMSISKGIMEDVITERLFSLKDENTPIVQTIDTSKAVKLFGTTAMSLPKFIKDAQNSYAVIQSESQSHKEAFIIFCAKGKTLLTLDLFKGFTTIYNKPVFGTHIDSIIPYNHEHIEIEETDGYLHFKTLVDGYVTIDFNNTLTLIPPYKVSEDHMLMEGILFPVKIGFSDLLKSLRYLKESFEEDMNIPKRNIPELQVKEQSNDITIIPIRKGKKESDGDNAKINYRLTTKHKPKVKEYERVDLKEFKSFMEVENNQILLIKKMVTPPIDGYTVFGKELKAKVGKDIVITAGENVKETLIEEELHYSAKTDGIYFENNNTLWISETLEIQGDAGVKTGNITYSKDITITGSVISGYSVKSGMNISIGDCIEDNTKVECEGSLIVKNGIFGERSKTKVKGNLEVGFIQDSTVIVEGDLLVHSSILNSYVIVLGEITVLGKKIDKDSCSIIGGVITTMKGLRAHSIGSVYSKTKVYCGYNPEMHKNSKELYDTIKKIDIVLIKIQNSIGFNIRDKHNIKRLAYVSDEERSKVKDKLKKLKEVSDKKVKMEKALEKVRSHIYSEDQNKLYIQIDNLISPDITLYLGHDVEKIKTKFKSIRYYLEENEIKRIDSKWKKS